MSPVPKAFARTLPFLKVLQKSRPKVNKVELLKKFPDYVANDIVELLYNILTGNVPVNKSHKTQLSKHRKAMHRFADLPSLKSRRDFMYKQKGGFLSTIIPLAISALGSLFR